MQSICTFLCLDSTYSPSHKNASTWGLRCAIFWCPGAAGAVGGGKQENTWRTGAHSLPQLCTLNTSGGEDHKRFLQIEAVRAGVLVAADVWLACTHHHLPHTQPPAECSQPKCPKMQKNKDVKIKVILQSIPTSVLGNVLLLENFQKILENGKINFCLDLRRPAFQFLILKEEWRQHCVISDFSRKKVITFHIVPFIKDFKHPSFTFTPKPIPASRQCVKPCW